MGITIIRKKISEKEKEELTKLLLQLACKEDE